MNSRLIAIVALLAPLAGCGGPSKVNVQLRKENQDLKQELTVLKHQHQADTASMVMLQKNDTTRPATLSIERLNELFTVSTIDIGKLTSARSDGLKVYVTPRDAQGDPLKSAGAITVEAFDLANKDKPLLGHWDFPAADAGKNWYESIIVRGYALTCPVTLPASTAEVTIRVTFVDSLTQRTLAAQKLIPAKVPDSAVN